jgi:hypothetical protein
MAETRKATTKTTTATTTRTAAPKEESQSLSMPMQLRYAGGARYSEPTSTPGGALIAGNVTVAFDLVTKIDGVNTVIRDAITNCRFPIFKNRGNIAGAPPYSVGSGRTDQIPTGTTTIVNGTPMAATRSVNNFVPSREMGQMLVGLWLKNAPVTTRTNRLGVADQAGSSVPASVASALDAGLQVK